MAKLNYQVRVYFVGENGHKGFCEGLGCLSYFNCRVPWKKSYADKILDEWGWGV